MIHGNWHDKYGIEDKEQLSEIKIIPNLIKALNDNDEYVQLSAIQEIRKFGSQAKNAGPVLTKLIVNDKSDEVKIRATLAIGEIHYNEERTINILSKNLLLHRNVYVKNASAIALGENGEPTPGAMSALRDASRMDEYEIVKTSASKSYSILSLKIAQSNYSPIFEQKKVINKPQELLFIGLTDLDAINVDSQVSLALSNRLGSELYQSGYFIVLERQKMQEILKEQGFQLSGCTSNECVVEMENC